MSRTRARLALGLATLVCAAAPAAATSASWRTYQVRTAGFAVALPASWVDVTSATPAMLKRLEQDPSLKATAQLASQTDAIRLLVADPASNGRAYVDAGVQRVGAVTPAALAAATAKDLKQVTKGKSKVRSSPVKLPAGSGYRLQLDFTAAAGPVETIEYVLVHDQVEYVVAFTTPRTKASTYLPQFERSVRSFRFLPWPNLAPVVLSAAQVGPGYRQKSFPQGNSVIGETTLDLCGGTFPSESLRTGRLQVQYTHAGHAVSVSNEVVTYLSGGARQALAEVQKVARACASKSVVQKVGTTTTTFTATLLHEPKLLPGYVAARIHVTAVEGKKHLSETGVAIYQVKGNTLSGIYVYVTKGTTIADAERVALHAAQESARKLAGFTLSA